MKFTERVYHDRQPRAGDKIVATHSNGCAENEYEKGNEMTIILVESTFGDCVFAINHRTGKNVCIHKSFYRIYTDVVYEKTGEKHVVKKLFGIPFYREIVDIYKEVGAE